MTFASHAELNIITLDGPPAYAAGAHHGSLINALSAVTISFALKPGDKVSFTAEREDGVMTIKEITKE